MRRDSARSARGYRVAAGIVPILLATLLSAGAVVPTAPAAASGDRATTHGKRGKHRHRHKRRMVRSKGGALGVQLGSLAVRAPKGAIRRGQTLVIERGMAKGFPKSGTASIIGGPYTIASSQGEPAKPVTVTFDYDPKALGAEGKPLVLHGWEQLGDWVPEATAFNRSAGTVSAKLDRFSPLDVADYVSWIGGRLTHNRTSLPGNCGEVPDWIDGASFPMGRNEALPACISNQTDAGALRINIVNNRGYAQLVKIEGATFAIDRSGPWSDSVDAMLAKALAEVDPANGSSTFVLAPGASATVAVDRPANLIGERPVSIKGAPRDGSAGAQIAWSFLKEASSVVAVPAKLTNCLAGVLYNGGSSGANADSAVNGMRSCAESASGLSGVAKAALKKIGAAVFAVDIFNKVIDLAGDEAFPPRISFSFKGKSETSRDIRVEHLDVGIVPAGKVTNWKLEASGGTPPYTFGISTIAANQGRVPSWVVLSPDGTLSILPPDGTAESVSFYVYAADATGQRSGTKVYAVTFTVSSPATPGGPTVTLHGGRRDYFYQANALSAEVPLGHAVATGLPAGFHMSEYGTVSGIPRTNGTYTFHATWKQGWLEEESREAWFEFTVTSPPPIPAHALPHLGAAGDENETYAYSVSESPDGRYLAVDMGGITTVLLYDTQTEVLKQLTWGTEGSGGGYGGGADNLAWSPDGKHLAFTSAEPLLGKPANYPWYDIYLYDVESGELQRLTSGDEGEPLQGTSTVDSYNPSWSPDGSLLTFTLGNAVAIYDPATEETQRLSCGGADACRAVVSFDAFSSEPWSADSQHLTFIGLNSGFYDEDGILVWDRATEMTRTVASGVSEVRLSPDGERAFASRSLGSGQAIFDIETGAEVASFPSAMMRLWDGDLATWSVWSPDGGLVVGERCVTVSSCEDGALEAATGTFEGVGHATFTGWRDGKPAWCVVPSPQQMQCRTVHPEVNPPFDVSLPYSFELVNFPTPSHPDSHALYVSHYSAEDGLRVIARESW